MNLLSLIVIILIVCGAPGRSRYRTLAARLWLLSEQAESGWSSIIILIVLLLTGGL